LFGWLEFFFVEAWVIFGKDKTAEVVLPLLHLFSVRQNPYAP
jgi:hypothetical protein